MSPDSVGSLISEGLFGIVIGPSGTGNTALMRKVCSSDPEGILYLEVFDPRNIAQDLGTAVGMVQQPTSPIDLLLTHLSGDSYAQYHKIPSDESGLQYVHAGLEKQAIKYKAKYNRTPVLIIDGVHLVAKKNRYMFVDLVDRAKYLANARTLKIVLVSSEGIVMPLWRHLPDQD